MKDADRLRSQLATIYEMKYRRMDRNLDELSQNIGVSKSYISLFLNDKIVASPKLLRRVREFIKRSAIDPADERLLIDIFKILDRAKDEGSILAALLSTRGREAVH